MLIKGVFFDFFGTLVIPKDMSLRWSVWYHSVYPIYKKNGINVQSDVFASIAKTFWSNLYDDQEQGISPFEKRLASQFEFYGMEVSSATINTLASEISEAWFDQHYLDDEAFAVLRYFKKKMKTALITNFDHPSFIWIMLARYRILDFFDSVIISGDVGMKKPTPEIFNPALTETGLTYEDVVYVGDSIIDFRAALLAGILPIIIRREGQHDSTIPGNVETVYEKSDTLLHKLSLTGQIEVVSRLSDVKKTVKKLS